jgi:hypothetical protein
MAADGPNLGRVLAALASWAEDHPNRRRPCMLHARIGIGWILLRPVYVLHARPGHAGANFVAYPGRGQVATVRHCSE